MKKNSDNDNLMGNAIRRNRKYGKMTAKDLGIKIGLPKKNADIRIYQYENGSRIPKESVVKKLAEVLAISEYAITPLDISTEAGVFHTLMNIVRLYDIKIEKVGEMFMLVIPNTNCSLVYYLEYLYTAHSLYKKGKITGDDYMYIADCADVYINNKYTPDTVSLERELPRKADADFNGFVSHPNIFGERVQETYSRVCTFIKNILPEDDETVNEEMAEAIGDVVEFYDSTVIPKAKELLHQKMREEQDAWLEEISQLTPEEIINLASIISVREQIICSIKDTDFLSLKQAVVLLDLETPLSACYEHWSDNADMDGYACLIEDVVKDYANIILHE